MDPNLIISHTNKPLNHHILFCKSIINKYPQTPPSDPKLLLHLIINTFIRGLESCPSKISCMTLSTLLSFPNTDNPSQALIRSTHAKHTTSFNKLHRGFVLEIFNAAYKYHMQEPMNKNYITKQRERERFHWEIPLTLAHMFSVSSSNCLLYLLECLTFSIF